MKPEKEHTTHQPWPTMHFVRAVTCFTYALRERSSTFDDVLMNGAAKVLLAAFETE